MIKKNERAHFLIIILIVIALWILGCPSGYSDKLPSYFKRVDKNSNTFRMVVIPYALFTHQKEHVFGIKVYETSNIYSKEEKVWWEIKTIKPVDAEGFEVIVGQVPDGFEQIIPPNGQIFKPIHDKEYYIAVELELPALGMSWIPTYFIAD